MVEQVVVVEQVVGRLGVEPLLRQKRYFRINL